MTASIRMSSFLSRVDYERAVLRAANTLPGVVATLHGLTPNARQLWLEQLPRNLQSTKLPELLECCWEELGKMSDQSRNVFEVRPDRPDIRVSLLDQIVRVAS